MIEASEAAVREWLAGLEKEHGVGPDGTTARCPETRQPYVTLAWSEGGEVSRLEGHPMAFFETPEQAWGFWKVAMAFYLRGRSGKIRWRHRPELLEEVEGYAVYARLVVDRR